MASTAGPSLPRQVRSALARLYDLPYLQTHPLARETGGGKTLQHALLDTIDALGAGPADGRNGPADGRSGPAHGPKGGERDGRASRVLRLTYVEGLPAREVCRQLGLSKSVYYREHARGVAALAALLVARLGAGAPSETRTRRAWPGAVRLTSALTSFVGREAELSELRRLVEEVRLVTLTGPPGCGKTRLARELLAALAPDYPEAAHFVLLAPLRDPDLVLPTIAEAIGVRPARGQSLAEALRERRMLLVLDNAEHLPDAGPGIAELAAACPDLRVVVTSRALLGVYGEHGYALPPLALPEPGPLPPAEELLSWPAVRLFVERARAARPAFVLDADNAAAVVAVCRRLDGLPLAIELAAARTRLLPPAALLARLDRRLSLLAGGPRDHPEHQRSLRAAIAWSHELLDADEQAVLRRLGVFVGGAALDAVSAIAEGESRPHEVLAAIGSLVDKSLVQPVETVDAEARIALLETIREFALDELAAAGEREAAERAHAAYFRAFAERYEPDWGPEQPARLDRLERDEDNLRAALAWAIDHEDAETALGLGAVLWQFWRVRGKWEEGHRWLRRALALPGAWKPTRARAIVLHGAGLLAAHLEAPGTEACPLLEESLALWRRLGDRRQEAWVLYAQGVLGRFAGDVAAIEAPCTESLALARAVGDRVCAAACLWALTRCTDAAGMKAEALALTEESLALAREAGSEFHVAHGLHTLGIFAARRGDLAGARRGLEAALAAARAAGDRPHAGGILIHLGQLARAQGDAAAAAALTAAGMAGTPADSTAVGRAWGLLSLAEAALGAGEHDRAEALLREALPLMAARPGAHDVPACLARLAEVALAQGAPQRAACLLGAAAATERVTHALRVGMLWPRAEPDVRAVRAALGPEAFAAARAAGEAMSLREAIDYALRDQA